MNDIPKVLSQLPARSIRAVLVDIQALSRRLRKGERIQLPLVTLHLRSGQQVRGWVLDLVDGGPEQGLLLQVPGHDLRQTPDDVLYVDPGAIEALTIHSADAFAKVLAGAEAPPA